MLGRRTAEQRQKGQPASGVPSPEPASGSGELTHSCPGPAVSNQTCYFSQIKIRDPTVDGEGLGIYRIFIDSDQGEWGWTSCPSEGIVTRKARAGRCGLGSNPDPVGHT